MGHNVRRESTTLGRPAVVTCGDSCTSLEDEREVDRPSLGERDTSNWTSQQESEGEQKQGERGASPHHEAELAEALLRGELPHAGEHLPAEGRVGAAAGAQPRVRQGLLRRQARLRTPPDTQQGQQA